MTPQSPQPKRPNYLIDLGDVESICDIGDAGRKILEQTLFKSQDSFNPRRGRRIANIVNDMFEAHQFKGKKIIELGPGHYGFALIARHLGAEVVCIEKDPAFVELGRHLGFEVKDQDFNTLSKQQFSCSFDGLFAKGTFNACNAPSEGDLAVFVETITSLLEPDSGWGWFTTVNKSTSSPSGISVDDFVLQRVEAQRGAFESNGWDVSGMFENDRRRIYALNYANSLYFFSKSMKPPGYPLS